MIENKHSLIIIKNQLIAKTRNLFKLEFQISNTLPERN